MKIEILYPELCCLYGDKGNTLFLKQCLPESEFIDTQLNEKPHFLREEIDLCCMYSMSEKSQELILDRLMQWKDEIAARCSEGKTLFLLLGNAMELFGRYIHRINYYRVLEVFRQKLNHDMTKGSTGQIHNVILRDPLDCIFCDLSIIRKNRHGFKLSVNGRSNTDLLWQNRSSMCPFTDALLLQQSKIPPG